MPFSRKNRFTKKLRKGKRFRTRRGGGPFFNPFSSFFNKKTETQTPLGQRQLFLQQIFEKWTDPNAIEGMETRGFHVVPHYNDFTHEEITEMANQLPEDYNKNIRTAIDTAIWIILTKYNQKFPDDASRPSRDFSLITNKYMM